MEDLGKKIKAKRTIKQNTLNIYLKNINLLSKKITGEEYKNDNFLKQFEKVKKILEEKTISTKKNYLATILVVLMLEDDNEKIIRKYRDYLNDVSDKYYSGIKEQKKSDRQSANWVGLKKLRDVLNTYAKRIRQEGINKPTKKVLSKKDKDLLQKYLVASLYLLDENPPRRNAYSNMRIASETNYNKIKSEEKNSHNWLVVKSRNRKHFIFNDYKTKQSYGTQKIRLGSKLNSVVNLFLKFHDNRPYLLYNSRGKPMTSNGLTKYLQKVFKPTGKKNISSTMIRHIFVSDKFDLPKLKEQEETAKKMGHSVKTQVETYYKHDE